jgi:regulator of protease activity HflC (stomatin/prohibitin superfamily)
MSYDLREVDLRLPSGWTMLAAVLLALPLVAVLFIGGIVIAQTSGFGVALIILSILLFVGWIISLNGFIIINPNESRVIQLFGKYVGTVKDVGFFYGNPFYWKTRVSLRVQTFETGVSESAEKKDAAGNVIQSASRHRQPSKVNDRDGTPIEIAAVVVYRIVNAAHSVFQVDDANTFVQIQSDSALRNLATQYSYDNPDDQEHSLRGHTAEVAGRLQQEIQERVAQAGVEVIESRISYLAYAPEIAAAMLQRQQAGALIAARQKIVEGAVGMVEHALEMLSAKKVLELDEERKAAMVSNLLVVLCGHAVPQPVLNAGTIYQ